MEILDFDHATNAYDTYCGLLSMAGDAIKPHLEGKIKDADSDEVPRLEAVLRKTVQEATVFSILLYEEAIEQAPLLALNPAKNAELVKAQTRFSLEVKEAREILSKVDATKSKVDAANPNVTAPQ